MDREKEDELEAALRASFPRAFKKALPIAVQLAEQNFDLTLKLIDALRRRTQADINEQRAKWDATLDKRDVKADAVIRAIKTLKLKPIEHGGGGRKWPHGAQKAVKAYVETNDGIDVSPTWLSQLMRFGKLRS
jgi:hypothetical protein